MEVPTVYGKIRASFRVYTVAPKPWIGALAAGDSIILNICEGEEGEREKGADQGRLIL